MRARLTIIAPDLAKGVRAAVATLVPFYFASAWHRPELAWVALGGWLGSLADPGGPRRRRAAAAVAFLAFGSAAVAIAGVGAATTATAAIVLAAIVFAASLARALGATAGSLGTSVAIAAAIAVSRSGASLADAGLFAAGVAWAAASSTILWPVWPHLPLRLAIGRVFERLADYVDALAGAAPGTWAELARVHQRAVRAAIEEARATALALRARRSGETPAGSNLRVMLGAAEGLFFRVITLGEAVEHGATVPPRLADSFRAIAHNLYTLQGRPAVELALDDSVDAQLIEMTREVAALARDLDREPATPIATEPAPRRLAGSARAVRDALSPRGPIVHHALRAAIASAAAVAIGRIVTPMHPTWVTVTVIAVLQPYLGPTFARAIERVVGTILGAAIAVAMMASLHSALALVALLFPLSVAAIVTRPRSYRLFVLFLTPVFVLVMDFGNTSWETAAARIADVAIGGVIALAAALIVPSHERLRLPDAVAGVLAAMARYVDVARSAHDRGAIVDARREVGLALEAAEASLERMLAEPAVLRAGVEDAMYLVTYARRLSAGITGLLESGDAVPQDIADYLAAVLDDTRAYVVTGATRPPRASPSADRPELARLVRRGELVAQPARRQSPPSIASIASMDR